MSARVFFLCTGLGREARGFETFTRECAAALRSRPAVSLTVFAGGGVREPGERAAWSLARSGAAARVLGALAGRDPYFIEQATFFAGFLPALLAGTPDLVYFADLNLGNALWWWRRVSRMRYRLLYYNGGATTRPFSRCDFVQQVSPEHLDAALARGERANRQVLLPHGVAIARDHRVTTPAERADLRRALGVPVDGPLVLSVGALDASVKRVDYVIAEVAALAERPHLLLLGAETRETSLIRARAASLLEGRCTIRTVPRAQVTAAYRAADAFVLASLREGFGIALAEALAAGVPCIAHDTPTSAYILGQDGTRADLRPNGALARVLARTLAAGPGDARARHDRAYERFSWDRLAPRYEEMLVACAAGRRPGQADAP